MRRSLTWLLLLFCVNGLTRADDAMLPAPNVEPSTVSVSTATEAAIPQEPYVFPVKGRPHIVSGFGERSLKKLIPLLPNVKLPDDEWHEGIDFALAPGSSVLAAHSGKVIFAGFSSAYVTRKNRKEKHRFLIVRGADGMSTRYVHLNRILVHQQEVVSAGQVLATSADSDEWTQPVLHFEIRNAAGKVINPLKLLPPKPL